MPRNEFDPKFDDDDEDDDDFLDEEDLEERESENQGRSFDLEELIAAWEDDSPDNLYYFDTTTGAVKMVNRNLFDLRELTDEIEKNKERYLYLPKPDAKQLKGDLRDFQKSIEDQSLKRVLDMAFESPHLLSSFKVILKSRELVGTLEHFLRSRSCLRIRQWMDANALTDRWQIEG